MTKNEELLLLALGDLLDVDETYVQCDASTYLKWHDAERGKKAIDQARAIFRHAIDTMLIKNDK